MDKEKLEYFLEIQNSKVEVKINYTENSDDCSYACYLEQNGVFIKKVFYQKSGVFNFTLNNGVYRFVVFAKNTDTENEDYNKIVFKTTKYIKIESYKICSISTDFVNKIIDSSENFLLEKIEIEELNKNIKHHKYLLIDTFYLIEKMLSVGHKHIEKSVLDTIEKAAYNTDYVILLNNYFSDCEKINNIVSDVLTKCNLKNVYKISTYQILKNINNTINFEDYEAYKRVLIRKINSIIDKLNLQALGKTYVDANIIKDNTNDGNTKLVAKIKNEYAEKYENTQYCFYVLKNGNVCYKSEKWNSDNEFQFNLTESGIYCVQGYIKLNSVTVITKSYTVEYFTDNDRKDFNNFLADEKYNYNFEELEFFQCKEPFEDFVFINTKSKVKDDIKFKTLKQNNESNKELKFYSLGTYGKYNSYLISSMAPVDKNRKKYIFSGMIYDSERIVYGKDCVDYIEKNNIEKFKGIYSLAIIEKNRIFLSNDFFNFNRLFYYEDANNIICSNRYHMLLIAMDKLKINCEINEDKALLNLSSANIQLLEQNTLSEMDIKGVYKCLNSYDIELGEYGIKFIENEYGKILNDNKYITDAEYIELLYKGKKEIEENVNAVINDKNIDNVIVDLSGGLDSRIVYGAALQNDNFNKKLYINSYAVRGSKDLDIAVKINNIYNCKWDTTSVEKSNLDVFYSDKMQRSFYMGIYYSHNSITTNNKALSNTVRLSGACGEILLRPYIVRKYFNTMIENIDMPREFLERILMDYSADIITDYNAAKKFVDLHISEFENYNGCSLFEIIDRIYLEHRHGYHFDQGIMSKHGISCVMPLQSKNLFKLHHAVYNYHRGIKLQLDLTNIIDPYLSSVEYDYDKDNKEKEILKDELYYSKSYHKNINLSVSDVDFESYNNSINEKRKNSKYIKTENTNLDFYFKLLCDLQYICKHNDTIKNEVGMALYYYINNHKSDSFRGPIRYLYNKISSLKDQMNIINI